MPNFLSGFVSSGERPNPRKETFFQMLKFAFCPNLTMRNFIALMSVLQVITFLITLLFTIVGSGDALNPNVFLGPDKKTYKLFDKYPYAMRDYF